MRFLPRRTYENYLLHSAAITAVLNELESFEDQPVSTDVVHNWLSENGGRREYTSPELALVPFTDDWERKVNAPKVLGALFYDLSGGKEFYQKVKHSRRLTEWIVENDTAAFGELLEYLGGIDWGRSESN